jgi:quercetin dioxygenase-like cupin family protein
MELLDLRTGAATPITDYASRAAWSATWAHGDGEAHVSTVRLAPGGLIGPHPTGFAQLFVVLEGTGWVSGVDDVRVPITAGQAAYFPRGVRHAKGATTDLVALMIQVYDLALAPDRPTVE